MAIVQIELDGKKTVLDIPDSPRHFQGLTLRVGNCRYVVSEMDTLPAGYHDSDGYISPRGEIGLAGALDPFYKLEVLWHELFHAWNDATDVVDHLKRLIRDPQTSDDAIHEFVCDRVASFVTTVLIDNQDFRKAIEDLLRPDSVALSTQDTNQEKSESKRSGFLAEASPKT